MMSLNQGRALTEVSGFKIPPSILATLLVLNVATVLYSCLILVISVHGMLADCVEDPVHFCSPAAMVSIIHLLHEVVQGLLLRFVQGQCFSNVRDVIK